MRGIPTIPASKISCGFSNEPKKFQRTLTKRAGGAMLLDISDLPQPPTGKKPRRPPPPTPPTAAAPKATADGKADEPKKRGRKPKQQPSTDAPAAPAAEEQQEAAAEVAVEKPDEVEQPPQAEQKQSTPNYPWFSGGYDPTATESFEPSGGDSPAVGEGVIARPVTSGHYGRPPPLMQQQRPDEPPQPLLRNFITPFGQQSASSFDSPNGGFGAFTYF